MKIQIKRSNQLVDGEAKAPEEDMLDYGELAVNFNEADPAIFIKASDGAGSSSIVRLAGANVDPPSLPITFTAIITDTGADGNLVGKILTAEAQNISGGVDPVESAYQWYINGMPVSTSKTRAIQPSDIGGTITCDITVSENGTGDNPVTQRATYAKTPAPAGSISTPTVLTPPDGAGIGGDTTYTPKTSAIDTATETSYTHSTAMSVSTNETLQNTFADLYGVAAFVLPVDTSNTNGKDEGRYWEIDLTALPLKTGDEIFWRSSSGSTSYRNTGSGWYAAPDETAAWIPMVYDETMTYYRIGIDGGLPSCGKFWINYAPNNGNFVPDTVSISELTLTDSNTYNNADGSAMTAPISQTFLAGQTVSGVSATGTYGTDSSAFETLLWAGNSGNQTLTTTVDLSERSLFWTKERSFPRQHFLYTPGVFDDLSFSLSSDTDFPGQLPAAGVTDIVSVDSTSITLGNTGSNYASSTYVGWGFRAAPGFLDIVTYTGDDTDKSYAHSLGTKPGCMIVKSTNNSLNWQVYHQYLGYEYPLMLNSFGGIQGAVYTVFSAEPTASEFSVGGGFLNVAGYEYIAYLFADTPGKIKCDAYTGVSGNQTIECGFKPGWVLFKSKNDATGWFVADSERTDGGYNSFLSPNSNGAEDTSNKWITLTNTGFTVSSIVNSNGTEYIYVAIAENVVAGEFGPTGTLTADANDNGPTITLSDVTGTWEAGMEVVNDTEITEFAPGADDLAFTSSVPAGTNITAYGQATWQVDTDVNFSSPMTATKTIAPANSIQFLLPSERGAITLDEDTTYNIRVKYDAADPSGIQSAYSDANQFQTANSTSAQDGWNAVSSPETNQWNSVAYGNGKFVAVATNGTNRVMYSSDGITWTSASASENSGWISVTYGADKFVAVAINGTNRIMYSADGINWTSASAPEDVSWKGVTYGDGKFVAVAGYATYGVMYSTDGINWTKSVPAPEANNNWSSVTYGNGKFVAVAGSGTNRVMYSTDGINWTAASAPEVNTWQSVTYGDGKFVAVAYSGGDNRIMYSTDAITWNLVGAPEVNSWYEVTYGLDKFVAVAYDGTNRIMYSADAINWTLAASPEDNGWFSVIYGGDKFVAVSYDGTNQIMWSESGEGPAATFTAYDADNNKSVNDLDIVARYGVDPTADNTSLGIYKLTKQPTGAVAAYVPNGDKYKPVIDLSQPLEQAQAEAAQANARLDEANATIETMRSNFETRIAALESES